MESVDPAAVAGLPPAGAPEPCVFARALFAGAATCAWSRRHAQGEREQVVCTRAVARINCATLYALLVERGAFTLGRTARSEPLAHAQVMRLQCGGLAGLRSALATAEPDVHALVVAAQDRCGSLVDLPWDVVVRAIALWQVRRRSRGGRR